MSSIDLNADLGESPDHAGLKQEAGIIAFVSSANIACGGHAGDDHSMAFMVKAAKEHGTVIGAHPAYPDRKNFGRTSLTLGTDISKSELARAITSQIIRLVEIAAEHGAEVSYVKPHGALYNDAVFDREKAEIIAEAVAKIDPNFVLMGGPNSEMKRAAEKRGLTFIAEGFIDRRYTDDGHLQSRAIDGAVLKTQSDRLSQLNRILTHGQVKTASGADLDLNVQTLCLHGDSDGALDTAKAVHQAITAKGLKIRSFIYD